jgi:uracil-DNA glycosylase family 4
MANLKIRRYPIFKHDSNRSREKIFKLTTPYVLGMYDGDEVRERVDRIRRMERFKRCKKCYSVTNVTAFPTGNLFPKYFFIGDAPGEHRDTEEKVFSMAWMGGPSSKMLKSALMEIGIYQYCWFTNMLLCSVPKNRQTQPFEQKECHKRLLWEIRKLKPEIIVLLGWHVGCCFKDSWVKQKVVRVYHPAFYLRKNLDHVSYAKYLKESLERVEDGDLH